MQRIHRRKKDEIAKDFICSFGCGKAYGSNAALYTHIKNKHPNMSVLSDIKSIPKPKATGKKGRPLKKFQESGNLQVLQYSDCKICQEEDCVCDEQVALEEIERATSIMHSSRFIDFINCLGALSSGQTFSWVRNTEEDEIYLLKQDIFRLQRQFKSFYHFNQKYSVGQEWVEFMSFSSRYWDQKYINELYKAIFLICCYDRLQDIRNFLQQYPEFQHMRRCADQKPAEFARLAQLLRSNTG